MLEVVVLLLVPVLVEFFEVLVVLLDWSSRRRSRVWLEMKVN